MLRMAMMVCSGRLRRWSSPMVPTDKLSDNFLVEMMVGRGSGSDG
jgi:hypothetical protein